MKSEGGGTGRIGGGVPINYVRTASGGYAATIATENNKPEPDESPLDDSPLTLRDMMSDMVRQFRLTLSNPSWNRLELSA